VEGSEEEFGPVERGVCQGVLPCLLLRGYTLGGGGCSVGGELRRKGDLSLRLYTPADKERLLGPRLRLHSDLPPQRAKNRSPGTPGLRQSGGLRRGLFVGRLKSGASGACPAWEGW
jgi:hypothetical protein